MASALLRPRPLPPLNGHSPSFLDPPKAPDLGIQVAHPTAHSDRDLRLDFFRGLALLFIFLNHIPFNRMSWLTTHNYGFSDGAEIFVFLSGYAAALTYGRTLQVAGFRAAAARILRRCGQLYVVQLLLLALFTAEIAWVVLRFDNEFFAEELQVIGLFRHFPEYLGQALLLKFRPAFFDILPLYIVFLAAFPLGLGVLQRWPWAALSAAGLLYGTVQWTHVNLPAYPPGLTCNINPLAWQFLFVLGAFAGHRHRRPGPLAPPQPLLIGCAVAILGLAGIAGLAVHLPGLRPVMPHWLVTLPVAKPDLPPLRLLHFFALAYVTVSVLGPRPRFLAGRLSRLVIGCGQHSLPVFGAGILLSLTAHMVFVMVADSLGMHALVSLTGIAVLLTFGQVLGWFRRAAHAPLRVLAQATPALARALPTASRRPRLTVVASSRSRASCGSHVAATAADQRTRAALGNG
jgi:hypothetical protein